jgi:ATP-binding cassette subfamily F protein 3
VAELDQPVNSFSGGWRMRLQLARALMCPSDLLLLDEPTNHLDLDALVWLEAWLKQYSGTMVVISHDREFLDAVTNVTLHIDHGKLVRYGGNYSKFEDMRAEQMILQQAAQAKQQEKMAHLQKFIDRFKAKASKAKQAQSRVKALERMEKIAPVLADAEFQFEFKEPGSLPNPMLTMSQASLAIRRGRCSGRHAAYRDCQRGEPLGAGRPAHRHPGGQRPGQVHAGENGGRSIESHQRRNHPWQGPEHRLLFAAGAGRIAPGRRPAAAHAAPGAGNASQLRPPANDCREQGCATSLAPSISAATWSSRRWAA